MKTTTFLWIIIAVLLLLNGLLLFFFDGKTNTGESKILIQEQVSNNYNHIIKRLMLYMHYDNIEIRDIAVKKIDYKNFSSISGNDIEEKTVNLSEVLQGENLVFYYTIGACNSCVSEQFILLDKLRKKTGNNRILLFSDYPQRDVLLFLNANKIDLDFYLVGNDAIELPAVDGVSALLLLTSGQIVTTSYVLDIDTKIYANLFYDFAEKKFQAEK